MKRLEGRVAIVTGAGQGIGRGIARRFAAEGAAVVIAERDAASGRTVAAEIGREFGVRAEFVSTDVTDKAAVVAMVDAAVAAYGRVDVLVNNAWGGGSFCRLEHKTDADLHAAVQVALFGAFWAMQAVFPHMRRQGAAASSRSAR